MEAARSVHPAGQSGAEAASAPPATPPGTTAAPDLVRDLMGNGSSEAMARQIVESLHQLH